jgi:glutaredoxin
MRDVPGHPSVVMYSRRTCGLCDEARAIILAEAERAGFDYDEIHVDGRDDLERDYGLRVPVVLVEGREEFELAVDPARLRRLVAGDPPRRRSRLRRL